MEPTQDEPICLVSFELAHIRLGGGPWTRKSFWQAYRQELDNNRKTQYRNDRIRICRPAMRTLRIEVKEPVYFRDGALSTPGIFEPEKEY